MLTRLLKMLSGLIPLWRSRPQEATAHHADCHALDDVVCGCGMCSCGADGAGYSSRWSSTKRRGRADYRTCDTCSAFLTAGESSRFTCRRCSNATRFRHGPRPARASIAPGGVEISLPLDCPVAPGADTPRTMVRLGAKQAEALSRILLKPGSYGTGIGFDRNDGLLMVGWGHRDGCHVAEIEVWRRNECNASLTLSAAQAGRLGEDVAGCIGITWTDAPVCDHEFVDARNEAVASGEMCLKCGAIRAGNG